MSLIFTKAFNSHNYRLIGGLLAALLLSACATAPLLPNESLNAAKSAIANAERAEARQYAGAEFEEAQEKLALAQRAISAEQMIRAEQLALQSRVAAELAMARTEAAKAKAINRDMKKGIEALDEELQRQGDQQ